MQKGDEVYVPVHTIEINQEKYLSQYVCNRPGYLSTQTENSSVDGTIYLILLLLQFNAEKININS